MTTETVHVPLGDRSYDVRIGSGLIANAADEIRPLLARPRVAVLTDETVAAAHLGALEAGLGDIETVSLALPAGEATKSWAQLERSVEWLLAERIERRDVMIALGAFHQPALVLADIGVLDTLTPRDFLAGYGEVVKYGLLGDDAFFAWLETNGPALAAGDADLRAHAVKRSAEMKAEIVARDETEQGDRALLNLGHTFCHALEAATGYSDRLLHGEGVAIGCALAFELSARLGLCSQEDPSRVRQHLKTMGMKTDLADIPGDLPDADALIRLMGQDKKVIDGQLRFILARGIGDAFVSSDVPVDVLKDMLNDALPRR